MRIGDIKITSIVDGEIAIPTEQYYPDRTNEDWGKFADTLCHSTHNPVQTVGSFLIEGIGDRVILVDAGVGNKPTFPFSGGSLRSALLAIGVHPNDITDVLFTHLHFDHIGWASHNGKPFFENATYRCDQRDWDYFMRPDFPLPDWAPFLTDPAVDWPMERLTPVADRMEFWNGDSELFPGLETIDAAGHTPGTTVLRVADDGEEGLILGDLVHGYQELFEDGWLLTAHSDGEKAVEEIERYRKLLGDKRMPFVASHFPGMRWGRFEKDESGAMGYRELPV